MIAMLATLAMGLPALANATPSEDDIARAKAEEEAAAMSVAQIEVQLAQVTAAAQEAMRQSQIATEELNIATEALNQATAIAEQAKAEADQAAADFEAGKQEIATVAQTAYREGTASLDTLAPFLEVDGLRKVETKQVTLDAFSDAADTRMQQVLALEQVATVMHGAAQAALEAQEAATEEVRVRSEAAEAAAANALEVQASTEVQREVLVAELARKQNTTVELIEQREAALEAERQAAAAAAAAAEAERQAASEAEAAQQAEAASQASSGWSSSSSSGSSSGSAGVSVPSTASTSWAAPGAIAFAMSKLGYPYIWGGVGPAGYDCSGLVMMAYKSQGVSIPRGATDQYRAGAKIPYNEKQPGDLIFWGSPSYQYHVAMYIGNNQIIEAPSPGQTVRIGPIWGGDLMPYAVRY